VKESGFLVVCPYFPARARISPLHYFGSDYSESSHSRMLASRLHRGGLPALEGGPTM
jgi:hypothetical protein